jgi:hypothetical protein
MVWLTGSATTGAAAGPGTAMLTAPVSDTPPGGGRQDNLAVLARFGQGAYGTRLSSADIDGALRTGRAERDAELGVREGEG